jgi:hypothetical protein
VVWQNGLVVQSTDDTNNPINEALKKLGAHRLSTMSTEYDAVGLGRCRHTQGWVNLIPKVVQHTDDADEEE